MEGSDRTMNEPTHGERRETLKKAVRSLSENASAFRVFTDWIRSERDLRDKENRLRGSENTTTEAAALSTILDFVKTATTNPANASSANGKTGEAIS